MVGLKFCDIYPVDRLEETKKHLRRVWSGEVKTVFSSYSMDYEYRQMDDLTQMVENAVLNLEAGKSMPGFNVPRVTIDFGTISTASYWGGKIFKPEGGRKWIDPVIHSVDDIKNLESASPESGDAAMATVVWKNVCKELDTTTLPCSLLDIQGPLNTLSLMWEQQDFMMTMYDNPNAVHKALDMVTDHLIGLIRGMLAAIPAVEAPLWPFIWLPPDIGIGITEDYMPLLSPELYLEFGIPYVKRLSDEFKGVFIHCCGQFSHHIDNLVNSDINILGMEFVYPKIDIDRLFAAFGSSAVFVPNIMEGHEADFGGMTEYFENINERRLQETRLWYILHPESEDFLKQVEFLESII